YQIVEWFAPSARVEWYRDAQGLTTLGQGTNSPVTLREITGTGEFRVGEHLIFRLEFRHDSSPTAVFLNHTDPARTQNTFATEAIFVF
ncbi:MAG TPA: outer membrane beta-barrel protein, partial [Planctomycetota bacterium]|nr:outer membrane beta-barrel protein [Planctomycetota bacterium]